LFTISGRAQWHSLDDVASGFGSLFRYGGRPYPHNPKTTDRGYRAAAQKRLTKTGGGMALVVFLRGVNVGGHRIFRPAILAKELEAYGVVNVGAAGTFVVNKPGNRARFRTELLAKLPFEPEVMICDGRELSQLPEENPFGDDPQTADTVRFVSILAKKS